MSKLQRIILLLGSIGLLHTSMVPPVSQIASSTCRYHEFVERSLFFTRTYGVDHGDIVAMVSEFGVILSATFIAFLIAGGMGERTKG